MISLSSISAAIAAIIGVLLFPLFGFILTSYDLLFTLIIIALAAMIFGKWNPVGAMLSSLFFGLSQSLAVIGSTPFVVVLSAAR